MARTRARLQEIGAKAGGGEIVSCGGFAEVSLGPSVSANVTVVFSVHIRCLWPSTLVAVYVRHDIYRIGLCDGVLLERKLECTLACPCK